MGMSQVWGAMDTRLGSEVSFKLLSEDSAKDVDRLARIEPFASD